MPYSKEAAKSAAAAAQAFRDTGSSEGRREGTRSKEYRRCDFHFCWAFSFSRIHSNILLDTDVIPI